MHSRSIAQGWYHIALLVLLVLPLTQCAPGQVGRQRPSPLVFADVLTFHADFDSGNLETVVSMDAHQFLITPRPDYGQDDLLSRLSEGRSLATPWNGKTCWYHFAVSVPERLLPYAIRLHIDRSREYTDSAYASDKIPVTSCDGRGWRYVHTWEVTAQASIITDTLTCPTTYFALATPYPWSQMEHYIRHLATASYVTAHEAFAQTPSEAYQEALPLYYLRITDTTAPQAKRNVVVVSGQHPGHVVSAWMVTGLINFLLSDEAMAHTLRQHFAFHIYPAVNPKGVKYGHCFRSPDSQRNPNRAWGSNRVREIQAVREHLLAQTGGVADYFFDLFGGTQPVHLIYYFVNQPGAAVFVNAVHGRHTAVHNHTQGGIAHDFSWYDALAYWWSMKHLRMHRNPAVPPLSFHPSGAYAQGGWAGAPHQSTEMMAAGAALMQAIYDVDPYLPRH
jgi:hypothetical protein